MKTIPILLILFFCLTAAKAQEITAFPGFWSTEYYEDDTKITKQELKTLFAKNEEVNRYWKKSNKNETAAYLAIAGQTAGAFWLGAELGSDTSSDLLAPLATSLGFAIIAGIFINSANKNAKKAILTYNKQFDTKTTYSVEALGNKNGLGIAIKW